MVVDSSLSMNSTISEIGVFEKHSERIMDNLQMEAVSKPRHLPTRAQAIRDSVEIRIAMGNGAGQMIEQILAENDIELSGVDWSGPMPNWLLACNGEEVLGCCQVVVSKPIGYMEFLLVKPSVSFKLRAIALRKLAIQGMSTLYYGGAQYVAGMVAVKDQKFLDVIEKLNVLPLYTAHLVCKRIA